MTLRRLEGDPFPKGFSYNYGTNQKAGRWIGVHFNAFGYLLILRYRQKLKSYYTFREN